MPIWPWCIEKYSLGRTSGKSSSFSPLWRAYRHERLATHIRTLYFRQFSPLRDVIWRNWRQPHQVNEMEKLAFELWGLSLGQLPTGQEIIKITPFKLQLLISNFHSTVHLICHDDDDFANISKTQKISPQVFPAIISVWGLAQKHLILIEWITNNPTY